MIDQMKALFLAALISSLAVHDGFSQSSTTSTRSVSESERLIPLAYDVDVVVVGGTLRGVAAAEAAARNGAKVFLATDRPYLGEDVCGTYRLWLEENEQPETELGRAIYGDEKTAAARRVVTPMAVKSALDKALLDSKVNFLYGSYVTEVLQDPQGKLAGVVVANRSGRQAVRGKVIIDATDRAAAARIAGARFTPYPSGPQTFSRIVLGGKPGPKARDTGLRYRVVGKKSNVYPVYEYVLKISMRDGSWASFANADKEARDQSWHPGQAGYAEVLFQVPPDPVDSQGSFDGQWPGATEFPFAALKPKGTDHLFVLGGCADVSRETAAQLLRPLNGIRLGQRVGAFAAQEARSRQLATEDQLIVGGSTCPATIQAEVGEMLEGLRWRPSEGAIRSPARALPVLARYDTVVVGGGTGGAPAGIGAARAGARTLAIEYLHGLGGVGTLGRISIYYHGNPAGFNLEVQRGVDAMTGADGVSPPVHRHSSLVGRLHPFDIETKMEWLRRELAKAGADVWFMSLGVGSVTQDKRFTGVVVATPFGRGVILANTVIDATGNAVIPACAGLETQRITGEHISVQGTGLPPWVPGENKHNTDWTFVDDDDVMDMWRIHVVAKQKFKGKFDLGQLIDSRARRRIVGDIMIAPMDIINRRVFPDVITVASSDFDNHGFSSHDLFMVYRQERERLIGNVPYRALLPKGYDGILVTGLGMSAHGDAMPVLRMQRDVENYGYAAGYASAMAARDATTVRRIDVEELQRHLADIGTIPENLIGASDSYPLSPGSIEAAVASLGRDYTGIAQILTQTEMAVPLMRKAYQRTDDEEARLRYAHVLGILWDDAGAKPLIKAVGKTQWDKGWKFKGMGNYGPTTSPLDNLIIALGRTRDRRAIPVLIEKARQLTVKSELSHYRALAKAFESIGDPAAAKPLADLLQQPGVRGHAFLRIQDNIKRAPKTGSDNTTRDQSLRELILARALFRCGDYNGLGRKTLEAYSNDFRGHYATHARAILAERK